MTSSVVTGIIGIQTTGINGYGIFWPKISEIRDTQTPPNGASFMAVFTTTVYFPGGTQKTVAVKTAMKTCEKTRNKGDKIKKASASRVFSAVFSVNAPSIIRPSD